MKRKKDRKEKAGSLPLVGLDGWDGDGMAVLREGQIRTKYRQFRTTGTLTGYQAPSRQQQQKEMFRTGRARCSPPKTGLV